MSTALLIFGILTLFAANAALDQSIEGYPKDKTLDSYRTDTNVSLIRFYLYTRQNPGLYDYDELFVDDAESILNSHFDVGKKTKVVAHGFSSGPFSSNAAITLREAYLEKGKYV